MFCNIGVLENFAKLTEKHPSKNLFLEKLQESIRHHDQRIDSDTSFFWCILPDISETFITKRWNVSVLRKNVLPIK